MPSQDRVHVPYVLASLAFALTAGFGLGAIVVAALAFKYPLGAWWIALVQAHGHAQLFGWAGLFVLGVGLFFLPRLRGTTLARAELAPWALGAFCIGVTLRVFSQPLLAILDTSAPPDSLWTSLGRSGLALSGAIELAGTLLIVTMLLSSFRRARPLGPDAPIIPVLPYLALSFVSLAGAALLNAALSISTAWRGAYMFTTSWNDALIHLLIMGFIVPIAIALSVRNLPLFMRLAFPSRRGLLPIFTSYLAGLSMRLAGLVEQAFGLSSPLGAIGAVIEGGTLLFFVWEFDVLLRRKTPWVASRTAPPPDYVETRKPTRNNYPDYGEFGRFELLIVSAFLWLAFASAIAAMNGLAMIVGFPALFNPDVERHAITVGFITLLIFGMSVRMLPGFSGKPHVASTRLVLATFWLGNLAAFFRVAPLIAPGIIGAEVLLGSSGAIGWVAVVCLTVNLWRTFTGR